YRVGPYAAGGTGTFGGFIDYLDMLNKRDGGINGVKLTWEECETEYKNDRGEDPRRLDRLRPRRRLGWPRLPVRLPARDELLEPEHLQDQVHRDEGRRNGQVEGEEDRQPVPRLRVRQGDDPDPGSAGEEVRFHRDAHRGRPSRKRAGVAVAADPAGETRLGHPARLGRHEPGRPEDRREGRLSA